MPINKKKLATFIKSVYDEDWSTRLRPYPDDILEKLREKHKDDKWWICYEHNDKIKTHL